MWLERKISVKLRPLSRRHTVAASAVLVALSAGSNVTPVFADPQQPAPEDTAPSAEAPAAVEDIERLLNERLPEDLQGLMDYAARVSHAASAASEQVEQTKVEIDETNRKLDGSRFEEGKAQAALLDAEQRLAQSSNRVTDIALAKYRGVDLERVSIVSGASSPRAAIERSAYLASLSKANNRAVEASAADKAAASTALIDAERASVDINGQLEQLKEREAALGAQSAELDKLIERVTGLIDNLEAEEREAWVQSNNPIEVNTAEILADLAGSSSGAVSAALSKQGAPYSWGAVGPDAFDCSGLMLWAYQQIGKTIPRTSQDQLAGGTPVSIDDLQPGDIVGYYPGVTHVGMYIGDGKIVHASDYGIPVQVVAVDSMPISGASRY